MRNAAMHDLLMTTLHMSGH